MKMTTHIASLIKKRHDLIPGAAHTYSKGDDQFPNNAPAAILRGKGAYVWGSDGKKYLDWCMSLWMMGLGHVNDEVNRAVRAQIELGTNFQRPHPTEFMLAEQMIKLLPHVEMVKFAKAGSSVTTAAVKLARAYTGRKYVAVCAEHSFFSYDDWFIGSTVVDAGIPQEIKNLTKKFHYNDLKSLEALFKKYPKQIACIIMEAVTTDEPKPGFLKGVERLCKKYGAVFILDEMITGFRFNLRGAAQIYGLKPDLLTYGKCVANGYSLAVLGGKKEIMELGGIRHQPPKPKVFLLSSTHGAEATALVAAMKNLEIMQRDRVQEGFWQKGKKIRAGIDKVIKKHELEKYVQVIGFDPNLFTVYRDKNGNVSALMRTIMLQEMTKRGFLFRGYFALSASHKDAEINKTIKAFDESLGVYKQALESKNPKRFLKGDVCKPVFRKHN